jgi:hypothetical protein
MGTTKGFWSGKPGFFVVLNFTIPARLFRKQFRLVFHQIIREILRIKILNAIYTGVNL